MVSFSKNILLSLALATISSAIALPLEPRSDGGIKVDFKIRKEEASTNSAGKRSVTSDLQNKKIYYEIPLSIGSNNQKLSIDIDTGSADMWVVSEHVNCLATGNGCKQYGTYDPETSSTSHGTGEAFAPIYGDFTFALGEFFTDDVTLGGATVKQLQFGVANTSSVLQGGILGIGYSQLEVNVVTQNAKPYDNFPAALKKQGIISENLYSIYLNSPDANEGSIIFGGSDTSKYSGPLQVKPITSDEYFSINLDHISFDSGNDIAGGFDVILDTGATDIFLPKNVVDLIASHFPNNQFNSTDQLYRVDPTKIPSGDIKFSFDGKNYINVPLKYLVDSNNILQVNQRDQAVLGDRFLRSAYAIYNLDQKQISLAQAKY